MTYKNARKSTKKIDIFASVGAAYVSPLSGFAPPMARPILPEKDKKGNPFCPKNTFLLENAGYWQKNINGRVIHE